MVAVEGVAEEVLEQSQIYRLPGTLLLMCNPKQGFESRQKTFHFRGSPDIFL